MEIEVKRLKERAKRELTEIENGNQSFIKLISYYEDEHEANVIIEVLKIIAETKEHTIYMLWREIIELYPYPVLYDLLAWLLKYEKSIRYTDRLIKAWKQEYTDTQTLLENAYTEFMKEFADKVIYTLTEIDQ